MDTAEAIQGLKDLLHDLKYWENPVRDNAIKLGIKALLEKQEREKGGT